MSTRMVALLRGINVGRAKRISMADLRSVISDLGYTEVATLLQSGNVVFTVPGSNRGDAAGAIEGAVEQELGVRCSVITRTAAEFGAAVDQAVLLEHMTDPSRFLVGFLSKPPSADGLAWLATIDAAPDRIGAVGQQVYEWCPAGVLASPLTALPLERKLGARATMRNWNTVLKLRQMLDT